MISLDIFDIAGRTFACSEVRSEILVFPTSSQEVAYMFDELAVALADIGLILSKYIEKTLFFFSSAPFWPHEGPLVQSCLLFLYWPVSRCA